MRDLSNTTFSDLAIRTCNNVMRDHLDRMAYHVLVLRMAYHVLVLRMAYHVLVLYHHLLLLSYKRKMRLVAKSKVLVCT